jgi:hypothetical protein
MDGNSPIPAPVIAALSYNESGELAASTANLRGAARADKV